MDETLVAFRRCKFSLKLCLLGTCSHGKVVKVGKVTPSGNCLGLKPLVGGVANPSSTVI